jgi:hypothetical protein
MARLTVGLWDDASHRRKSALHGGLIVAGGGRF